MRVGIGLKYGEGRVGQQRRHQGVANSVVNHGSIAIKIKGVCQCQCQCQCQYQRFCQRLWSIVVCYLVATATQKHLLVSLEKTLLG